MPRRVSIIALFAAWFCASGAMLDVFQVLAWAKMFTQNTQLMPVAEAVVETFDPNKPCPICMAVRRAREESRREQPANAAREIEKIVLTLHEVDPVILDRESEDWPAALVAAPKTWCIPVPVPPPRSMAASWMA
jgi:hypothetical protein